MSPTFARNVILKALALFVLANLLFAALYPLQVLGSISAYNHLLPGRKRLPYGDNPALAYNLSLYNLPAMFASHEIAAPKPPDEYRVLLIGDSSVWGWYLPVEDSLSEQINALDLHTGDGRRLRAYNLGYPVMSLTKDLLLLEQAQAYQPDLIVWLVTLESLPADKQLFPPLLQNNPAAVRRLIDGYTLPFDTHDPALHDPTLFERSLIGARRPLADLLRLQLYGLMWAATGLDQDIPADYTLRASDLEADERFHGLQPPELPAAALAWDVLHAGVAAAGDTPLLMINEPIFISRGQNSHIRYNFFYPRWAYDAYRQQLSTLSAAQGWHYLDAWDAIPAQEFTNSAVHLSPAGSRQLARLVAQALQPLLP